MKMSQLVAKPKMKRLNLFFKTMMTVSMKDHQFSLLTIIMEKTRKTKLITTISSAPKT